MHATHLIFVTADGAPVALAGAGVRRIVSALHRACAGARLLAFHISDSHIHLLVLMAVTETGRFSQRVAVTLRGVVASPIVLARRKPIRDQGHLQNTFEYVLRNDERHGVEPDPWRENTALPDLLGLRVGFGSLACEVRRALPRTSGAVLRALADWPELKPIFRVEGAGAAGAAAIAEADLRSRRPLVVDACRAVTHLVSAPNAAFQAELGRSREAIRSLRSVSPRPELVRAIGLQLALADAVPRPAALALPTGAAMPAWTETPRVFLP